MLPGNATCIFACRGILGYFHWRSINLRQINAHEYVAHAEHAGKPSSQIRNVDKISSGTWSGIQK